ncbi:hypothetical protein BV210_17785 (plasmid) [Halorientalis sp. IM1011]|nr:hypothetical protein BV210_17785 [Halorientalis sp. IM1011]
MVGVTTNRPAPLSAVLSVVAAAAAIYLVATGPNQRFALAVTIGGLAALAVGIELWRREHRLLGGIIGLVGTGAVGVALVLGYSRSARFGTAAELLPGLVGLSLLVLGLGPIWKGRERLLFSAGTGLVFVSPLVAAVLYETTTVTLLIAGVCTVLAWDLAERAVNLGEQVGREARTYSVELLNGGATLAVGGVAIALVQGVAGANVTGLPLLALAGLLAAAFTLLVALYN